MDYESILQIFMTDQINNIIAFVHKILDYNYETRLSAEDCKAQLSLLEYQIEEETEI